MFCRLCVFFCPLCRVLELKTAEGWFFQRLKLCIWTKGGHEVGTLSIEYTIQWQFMTIHELWNSIMFLNFKMSLVTEILSGKILVKFRWNYTNYNKLNKKAYDISKRNIGGQVLYFWKKRLLFVLKQLNLIDKYYEYVFIEISFVILYFLIVIFLQQFANVDFGNVIKIDRHNLLLKVFRIRTWNLTTNKQLNNFLTNKKVKYGKRKFC